MRKIEKYVLFGVNIELSERNMNDAIALDSLYSEKTKAEKNLDKKDALNIEYTIKRIIQCFNYGYKKLNFIDKLKLWRKLTVKYFSNNIGFPVQLNELIDLCDEIEEVEKYKKKMIQNNQSTE